MANVYRMTFNDAQTDNMNDCVGDIPKRKRKSTSSVKQHTDHVVEVGNTELIIIDDMGDSDLDQIIAKY